VQLATREHAQVQTQLTSVAATTTNSTNSNNVIAANSASLIHEHPLKQERDHTLIQAGELSMKLADTRAMEDELRDELEDALATIKQHYTKNQNQNPYNHDGNIKYPAMHGHAHVPTGPQSQSQSKAPSHTATYHAVSSSYKTTINNSFNYNSPDSPLHSFWWPGRQHTPPKQNKSPPSTPPMPAWMTEILDHTESIEDESDSERSGSFPAHVTVHKKTTATATSTITGTHTCNASMDPDTNELPPLQDLADDKLTDAMDDGFAL
jgi:hypothetical protein